MRETKFEQVPLDKVMRLLKKTSNRKERTRVSDGWNREAPIVGHDAGGKHAIEGYGTKDSEKLQPQGKGTSGEGLKYPEWQAPLQEVILEFDRKKLVEKVQQAETSISARLQELRGQRDSLEEQDAIAYGLSLLRSIKHDKLGYPDWK